MYAVEDKILLWGIGREYNKVLNLIKSYEVSKQFRVVGVTDRDLPDATFIDGYSVIHKDKLNCVDFDYIIVMSDTYFCEIMNEAKIKYDVDEVKIINYKVLCIPYFDFKKYVILKASRISIISNNCWGGILCNTLGIECCSPFKNVSFNDEDYLKLLENLKYYMELKPEFLGEYQKDTNSGLNVPMLKLGDIKIKCNHYPVAQDAIAKWEERKRKINWDNLFIEMYTEAKDVAYRFVNNEYENKICFVPFESDGLNIYQLKMVRGMKNFYEIVNASAALGKNSYAFDLVTLLLSNSIVTRVK